MTSRDDALHALAAATVLAAWDGTAVPDWVLRRLERGTGGVVLFGHNVESAEQVAGATARLAGARPDLVVAIDEEGGDVTRLEHRTGSSSPGNAALGATGSSAWTREVYADIGRALASTGCTLDLAPCLDVNTAGDNPVIGTRSFGTDPGLVAEHGVAAVEGLQQHGVAACVKHFPGHGATTQDSHLALPVVDDTVAVVRSRDVPPFAAAVHAGAAAVMTAHVRLPRLTGELPATLSPAVLRGLLRDELGFRGVVVTDALDMRGASQVTGIPEAAVRALAAGADLLCIAATMTPEEHDAIVDRVVSAIRTGRLSAAALEASRARVAAMTAEGADRRRAAGPVTGAVSPGAGAAAARRAVRVSGPVGPLVRPVVLQVDTPASIAQGPVPWGLEPVLTEGADALRSHGEQPVGPVLALAAGRPLVVVVRDAHRQPVVRATVTALLAQRPDLVLVDMGLPLWRPAGVAHVASYGGSRASAQAVADVLLAR